MIMPWGTRRAARDPRNRPVAATLLDMSKVDAQRAMREARYAALQTQPPAARRPAAPRNQPTAETPPVEAQPSAPGSRAAETATRLCGHRGSGNKLCQREAGHPEKSHRYK
jgi:hypothetical protein